jgi:hypothetical protein
MKDYDHLMKSTSRLSAHGSGSWTVVIAFLMLAAAGSRADQVAMQNGDRYTGSVLSLNAESVVVQSELLGKVTLPRSKVAFIALGTNVTTHLAPPAAPVKHRLTSPGIAPTNANADLSSALRSPDRNGDLIRQVREQYLGSAGAAANRKFDEMVDGLVSGRLTLNDLRAQAKSAADQLRALKKDLDKDDLGGLDEYLNILDRFVTETEPQSPGAAPAPNTGHSRLQNDSPIR